MYNNPHFNEHDEARVIDFVKQYSFAMLIGVDPEQKPVATQVPVFIDQRNGTLYLTGHIQRKTDHHKAFENNKHVLAVFTGAHAYVSASWYANQQVASTWNYMSVHVKGILRFLNEEELRTVLKRTTAHFEKDADSPALVEKMTDEYVSGNMKAIAAFEVEVTQMNPVFKLSQNRSKKDYENVVEHLKQQGGEAVKVAKEMEKIKVKVFPS